VNLIHIDAVPATRWSTNQLCRCSSSINHRYRMATRQGRSIHRSHGSQDRPIRQAHLRIWSITVTRSELGEGFAMDLRNMIQKTVSDLALKSTNRIPAMPLSQQEASTIKRILDSVSICPNEREPRLISLQATEVHPLLQSYVDQWPARAILQLICSNLTSRGAGKRSKPRGASVPPLPSTGLSRTQSRLSSVGPPTQDLRTSARTKKSVRIKTS
jgi:hypothetical protein